MTSVRSLTSLIVEPHSGMRASLHNMLNLCGVTRIDHAVSAGTTIRPLRNKSYDLILCEYDLGDGQDGQQLLEDLRHNKLIPLWTIFIIVTAERVYEKVVGVAELAPSDYILKPFTADMLLERIAKAIEKRAAFLPAYQLMEQGNLRDAVDVCRSGEEKYGRYANDFMRLRAELHIILGQHEAAEAIYRDLIVIKAVAWARLGLAKTLFMQEKLEEADALLAKLVEENSNYMAAYDWLAKTREATGRKSEAREILANAVAVSPHAVGRLRKLGDLALETGDIETAERSFQKVVSKAKYSEFRDPEDHLRLVRALVEKGDIGQASSVIRDLDKSLAGLEKTTACSALAAALLHAKAGDSGKAARELVTAVAACRDTPGFSNEMKMELARHCLQHGMESDACGIMRDVMSNAPGNLVLAKAAIVFEEAGRKELVESVIADSRRQVVELVSSGVERAKRGDYQGALELMTAAVHKLPDNPQVVFNAAVAVLKYLENLGWDSKLGEQARRYIDSASRLDPRNPRLVPLNSLYQTILKKYGIETATSV